MYRVLANSGVGEIASLLDEFIGYQIQLLTKVGGIERFAK